MENDNHGIIFPRPLSRLGKLQVSLNNTIDILLAMHALNIAKGRDTQEEITRMAELVAKVRPKLSEVFTVEQGIKAIVTAFKIDISGGGGK